MRIKNYYIMLILLTLTFISACKKDSNKPPVDNSNTVKISGKNYSTVKIGNKTWTATNYEGAGGIAYNDPTPRVEYGRYYKYDEVKNITLPAGWRLPTTLDYVDMARASGVDVVNYRATGDQIKNITSKTKWVNIPGNNQSGFNAYPAGYSFNDFWPEEGYIAEFWTAEGKTFSIQEGGDKTTMKILVYGDSGNHPTNRFNVRFVKD